ncbi:hypothetical protein AB0B25_16890 [Nocardia sp. NPDC049190]|uniref:hypothetical protein n=1 Tax=Nocardia sp. NPDC049190 TaxID=3155650 RepID=UPI00340B50C1
MDVVAASEFSWTRLEVVHETVQAVAEAVVRAEVNTGFCAVSASMHAVSALLPQVISNSIGDGFPSGVLHGIAFADAVHNGSVVRKEVGIIAFFDQSFAVTPSS